ncbi:hypothetical protein EI94DRAFT_1762127 [Lactarius quietus]|nr:hypothetical protein EI94DRAFT_1762127 [Lactarius quietus]
MEQSNQKYVRQSMSDSCAHGVLTEVPPYSILWEICLTKNLFLCSICRIHLGSTAATRGQPNSIPNLVNSSVTWRTPVNSPLFFTRQGPMALYIDETTVIGEQLCRFLCLYDVPGLLAILYYDYVLTFSREVKYFWPNTSRRGSWVSVIFFLNRYFAILGHIPIFISLMPSKSCEVAHHYSGYFGWPSNFLLLVMLCTMRVYALYNKNNFILLVLAAIAVASLTVGFIAITTESGDVLIHTAPPLKAVCHISLGLSDEGGRFLSAAWGVLLVFDVAVFVLTLYRATKVGYNVPLVQVINADPSWTTSVLFFVNLANILTLQTLLKNSATPLTNVLSVTLISRLMLRLRSDRVQLRHHSREPGRTMNSRFNSSLSETNSFWFPTIMTTHSSEERFELESPQSRAV